MSFPRYERYKDSGVEWLGEVPEHWEVNRLKVLADVFPSNVDKKEYPDEAGVRLCNYTDVYYNDLITDDMDLMRATASPDQIEKFTLRAGDTVLTKDSETADDIAVSAFVPNDLPGVICGYHLSIARPRSFAIGAFIKRLFDVHYVRAQAEVSANGLTRVGLSQYALDNFVVAYPRLPEQNQIAWFTKQETAKIDALIEEQRRLIDLLKEKRQAVISHAATKGLNPSAGKKSFGTDWFDTVPDHWQVKKLSQVAQIVRGGSPRPAGDVRYFNGSFIPWITVGEVTKDDDVFLSETETMLTEEGSELSRKIQSGTLIMTNSGATLGVPKVLGMSGCANDGILAFLNVSSEVDQMFVYHFLSSLTEPLRERVKQGSGQPNLNTGIVGSLPLPIPPLHEQGQIVSVLSNQLAIFRDLQAESAALVELLQERRSALISAAVTGKIDVRDYAKQSNEEAA